MTKRRVLVANWKLNPEKLEEARLLAKATDIEGVTLCPPVLFLEEVGTVLKKAQLGSQDIFFEDEGAFTGEISPSQLKNLGVSHVIVGHSERRQYSKEDDEMINKKVKAALEEGITPILCIGESKSVHSEGEESTREFLKKQLDKGLEGVNKEVIVAYEPIWAIGTGTPDEPSEAAETIGYLKQHLGRGTQVLYGGSVKGDNAASFLEYDQIDGFLVGGASLNPEELNSIADKTL